MRRSSTLEISLGVEGRYAELIELRELSYHVHQSLKALAKELTGLEDPSIRFEIVGAKLSSLTLEVDPILAEELPLDKENFLNTFTTDLKDISQDKFRMNMSSNVLNNYRSLIHSPSKKTPVRISFGNVDVNIDEKVRERFEATVRRTISSRTSVIGTIESINIHTRPYTFSLYTKLEPRDRIECRFEEKLLPEIAEVLKSRSLAEGTGDGHFGPVGLYPLRIILKDSPKRIRFDPEHLRTFIRKFELVPKGKSLQEYLSDIRKASENEA